MIVSGLWRHPVKSMQGHAVDVVEIDERGVVGDRRWGIRRVDTGNVLTGRREPALLQAIGRDGAVQLPNGEVTADADVLSAWLGYRVEFVEATDGVRSTYEVPLDPLDGETNWVSWQGPAASFVDSTRTAVSLIATGSMREWSQRRFRMNVVLDGDDDSWLVGKRVRIGSAVLDVVKPVDRCVMVTRPQPGMDRDLDVLKTILADHGGNLGVGAVVIEAGTIRIGDEIKTLGD